jgi:tetratricopeptide (TPR) repeat protein
MHVENYPKDLRMRLISLGTGFAEAILEIEDGDPKKAYDKFAPFVEKDAVARYGRARAAIAAGMLIDAVGDLHIFGEMVGHHVIDNIHSGALLSQLLAQVGRPEEALDKLEALRKKDEHPALAIIHAQLLEATDELEKAESLFQTLLKQFPAAMNIIRSFARVKAKLNKKQEATAILESGLSRCCTPGKCSSQPLDIPAVRMLAQLYLEDRKAPERCNSLLQQLGQHIKNPTWEDKYLSALSARNHADPFADKLAVNLLRELSPNDPRRNALFQSFPSIR